MVNILHTVDWDLRWYDFLHIMLDCYNWILKELRICLSWLEAYM